MSIGRHGPRPAVVALAVGAASIAALLVWSAGRPGRPTAAEPVPIAEPRREGAGIARVQPEPETAPAEEPADADAIDGFDASALAWSQVDLEAVRRALPDNLYWQTSVPTTDASILREREETRDHWNREYGKVLSNTATEQEVRDYYAHRRRVSTDAIEFAAHLLDHYGDVIPERDAGLLELALELHLARLEQLPRDLADALARREAHARVREQWLADQARFEEAAGEAEPPPM